MINRFISSLPAFTLESLVNNGRWTAAQALARKKESAKPSVSKKAEQPARGETRAGKAAL